MLWLATALSSPLNGNFEAGLTGWVDLSSTPGVFTLATAGEDFSVIDNPTDNLIFPSGSEAALLRGGPQSPLQVASMESVPFTVTTDAVRLQYYNETQGASPFAVLIFLPLLTGDTTVFGGAAQTWNEALVSVAGHCGDRAVIRINQTADADQGFTLIDDVEAGGNICPDYNDGDGDGFCPRGTDFDLDGSCTGVGESSETEVDCNDDDPTIYLDAPEVENDTIDQDCDGLDQGTGCFADQDGDGFGQLESGGPPGCDFPNLSLVGGDCDDSRSDVRPGAPELCDGVDTNCDTVADGAPMHAFADRDSDGFGDDATALMVCGPLGGLAPVGGDCDDSDSDVFPGATELAADGTDQDCDGFEDCYADLDMDGYGGPTVVQNASLQCFGDHQVADDCDDTNFMLSPGTTEECDGMDQNCDGVIDNGLPQIHFYLDLDGDGYGGEGLTACASPGPGYNQVPGDCDETNPGINPGVAEVPIDGIDQDCDGGDTCFRDGDQDGFGTAALLDSDDLDCTDPGESDNADDCDDLSVIVNPGSTEIPGNGIDENCDGLDDLLVDTDDLTFQLRGGAPCSTGTAPASLLFLLFPLLRRRG